MCRIANYPKLYIKANEILRVEGLKPDMPGYELLKRAIVIYKVEGNEDKDKFFEEVQKGIVIPANKYVSLKNKDGRKQVEQLMIEAIKSVGIDISLMEYIEMLAGKFE